MINWLVVGICSALVLASVGCGGSNKLAAGLLYDARTQIGAAKEAGAETLANQELADAEQMLSQAETTLDTGSENQAYRLGVRALLKARLARSIASLRRKEGQATEVSERLESKLRAADAAHRQFEEAEDELERLKATPGR